MLDEPGNGLDPEGIRWLRGFLRRFADAGRTVLVSSHALAEVAQTVDRVVIMARAASSRLPPWPSSPGRGTSRTSFWSSPRPLRGVTEGSERQIGRLISAELLKLRTARLVYGLLFATLALAVVGTLGTIAVAGDVEQAFSLETNEGVRSVFSNAGAGSIFVLVPGILGMTSEFRHNTVTETFLVTPTRGTVVTAKLGLEHDSSRIDPRSQPRCPSRRASVRQGHYSLRCC